MTKSVILAGGCFWCVEHDLRAAPGVSLVTSGYVGSDAGLQVPSYEYHQGYKEAVHVEYDEEKTSYKKILQFFIDHIDPTDEGGQFADRGDSYKAVIYYKDEEERLISLFVIKELNESHVYNGPSKIEVLPQAYFYEAEECHQNYADKNPLRYDLYKKTSGREAFINRTCAMREEKKISWKE